MAWKIELSAQVDRELGKLDPQHSKRILKFLRERLAKGAPTSVPSVLKIFQSGRILIQQKKEGANFAPSS